MLKSVDIQTVLLLVVCAIPQFLLYVIPFSILSASSMVLGDLGANNELLALRSLGVPMSKVFRMLIVMALVLTGVTFIIADMLVPWSARTYRDLLADVMRTLPTFEIRSDSVNTIGNLVMSNGEVSDDDIYDMIILTENGNDSQSVYAPSGTLELIDYENFVYRMTLNDPSILFTRNSISEWGVSDSRSAEIYMNFSDQVPALTSTSPSNLSSAELRSLISERAVMRDNDIRNYYQNRKNYYSALASSVSAISAPSDYRMQENSIYQALDGLRSSGDREPINFYYQYYTAELHKKMVLSFACLSLTIVTLPLSFIRIRYGRLLGFGLSLIVAVIYWYFLFGVQLKIFDVHFSSGYLMWMPDVFMFLFGLILLFIKRRQA